MTKHLAALILTVFLLGGGLSAAAQAVITSQPSPAYQTVTAGSSVTYSVTATGTSLGYRWYTSNPAATNPVSTSSSYTFTATGADNNDIIYVAVTSATGNAQSAYLYLYVGDNLTTPGESAVDWFGSVTAPRFISSLGFNVDNLHQWQYAAVAALGATWVRPRDCAWGGDGNLASLYNATSNNTNSELLTFANGVPASGGYLMSSRVGCGNAFAWAAQNNLKVEITSDFEPPYGAIAYATTTADNPAGSTTLNLGSITGGNLSYAIKDNSALLLTNAGTTSFSKVSSRFEAAGTLINSVSGTSVTLEAPTNVDIPSGSYLVVTTSLYPPVLIPPQSNSHSFVTNPSIVAYLNYSYWLGQQCASLYSNGQINCVVEFMNEPEQAQHLWEVGTSLYATPPPSFVMKAGAGLPIAFAAMGMQPPAGAKWGSGYSDVVGLASDLFNPAYYQYMPTDFATASSRFAWQSVHPYGIHPEENFWLANCPIGACLPQDGKYASNFSNLVANQHLPGVYGGLNVAFTETGTCLQNCNSGVMSQDQAAVFDTRQFLTGTALGVSPIIFYTASNSTTTSSTVEGPANSNFDFFDNVTQAPFTQALALGQLIADAKTMPLQPVAPYAACMMPQVTSYTGTYPLAHTEVVGASAGDVSNSIMESVWQLTYQVPISGNNYQSMATASGPYFAQVAAPAGATATFRIPASMRVAAIHDSISQTAITTYTLSGQTLTVSGISAHPLDILLKPISATTLPILSCT